MAIAYIGLGANLDNPVQQLKLALKALSAMPKTQLVKTSSFYGSKPLGPQDQPDFINAVCQLETELSPEELLVTLQRLEKEQGRIKKRHWGERIIDLDILLYDALQFESDTLTIPQSEMGGRDFVLLPLAEIAPTISVPGCGSIQALITNLDKTFVFALK